MMNNSHIVAALLNKRNEVAGEIVQLEKQVAAKRDDLAHLEATIRVFQPGVDLPAIAPKRIQHRARHFKGGTLTRLLLDYIREHPGEVIAVDTLLPLVIGDQQFSERDQKRLRFTIYQTLYRIEKRGTIIERIAPIGRTQRWRSVNS